VKRFAMLALSLCAACGGSNAVGGAATVTGTLGGSALGAKVAYSAASNLTIGSQSTPIGVTVIIGDVAVACGDFSANSTPKNSRFLAFTVVNKSDANTFGAIVPGTYPIYAFNDPNYPAAGKSGFGTFATFDATCQGSGSEIKTGGSVTITAVDSSLAASGTFDLTTVAGDHVTGSFQSTACSSLNSQSDAGATCH
jgi:hypothetical protein